MMLSSAFRRAGARRTPGARWSGVLLLLAASTLAGPAAAQVAVNADAGLGQFYKSQRWLPLQLTVTNAGKPARVEVRARFGGEAQQEYRLPEHTVQSNANEAHTLCLRAPYHYSAQPVALDVFSDGRLINSLRANTQLVPDGDWLVLGVGTGASVQLLGNITLSPQQTAPYGRAWGPSLTASNSRPRVHVATLEPRSVPDRWQALDAADVVVLGGVSERDFTPEQQAALRDWVNAGGALVVTGGPNWNRLATPFFQDLLPVRVTGSRTVSGASTLAPGAGTPGTAPFVACTGTLQPEARVVARSGGVPLLVEGIKGMGQVVFLAFDPNDAPFRDWSGTQELWKRTLIGQWRPQLVRTLESYDGQEGDSNPGFRQAATLTGTGAGGTRLADAPYAIPQLDIPSFYLVALFLVAYIVVLVPVNYFVLKARDKKEYAWLTTPAIVAVFSVGAYAIGYGFKGGRTLLVQVGVVEARAGQDGAPSLVYSGLFSPRKAGYELRTAAANGAPADAATLLSDPNGTRSGESLRVVQDDTQRLEDFNVDMWAMRMVKAEGIVRLNRGIVSTYRQQGAQLTGTIANHSPYTLTNCQIRYWNQDVKLPDLKAGQTVPFSLPALPSGTTPLTTLESGVTGTREEQRMKRSVLTAVQAYASAGQGSNASQRRPLLLGWIQEPVAPLLVDGRTPREVRTNLLLVHLAPGG